MAPRHSSQSPYAAATPMFAAAGIVVTEMSTPMSAPDFAVESDSMPAVPASSATMTENVSGCEMKNVWARLSGPRASGPSENARRASVTTNEAVIAATNPTESAAAARRAIIGRRRTTATHSAASGPNSGPTTIAPTIRIAESVRMPMAARSVAITMNAR